MERIYAGITGIGYYLPDKIITNDELAKTIDTSNEWIVERTGIRERHIAELRDSASDLGVRAAKNAIMHAGISIDEIDMIITASCTPDMGVAATACIIQDKLGAKRAVAFDITAACSGFIFGLSIAEKYIRCGCYKNILVVASEVFSRILDWDDRNTCVLFGDGAGAAVVSAVDSGYGLLAEDIGADGSGAWCLNIPAGGSVRPATMETVKNHEHFLKMDGKEVFRFAAKIIPQSVKAVLDAAGLTHADIDLFLPHQANIRIIELAQKKMQLADGVTFVNLDRVANTSAASIPIALGECCEQGLLEKGKIIVCCGFGAGLTWGTMIMRWAR